MYIVYQTTNMINQKYYIGVHKTNNLKDPYLGSGVVLKKAIKKYSKSNFIRKILHIFKSQVEAYNCEKNIVGESLVKDLNCYNLIKGGGRGNNQSIGLKQDKHPMFGKKHSEKSKLLMSLSAKGRKHTKDSKRKLSSALKGRIFSKESRKKMSKAKRKRDASGKIFGMQGKNHSKETKLKMSNSAKGRAVPVTATILANSEVYNFSSTRECALYFNIKISVAFDIKRNSNKNIEYYSQNHYIRIEDHIEN